MIPWRRRKPPNYARKVPAILTKCGRWGRHTRKAMVTHRLDEPKAGCGSIAGEMIFNERREEMKEIEKLTEVFVNVFGPGKHPVVTGRAPGRVNLIGEHTDYNEGFVFPMAVDFWIYFVARRRDDKIDPKINSHGENEPFIKIGRAHV